MTSTLRKRFAVLLVATALVVGLATWLASRSRGGSEARSDLWLPGLRAELDEVRVVHLTGAGNRRLVTIEQDGGGFVVVERDRYRADTAALRTLLMQMANARRIEAKTSRAGQHAALGVESIASAKAAGVRVGIEGPGKPLSLTIGRTAAQLGGGTFVRTGEEAQSWLVSGDMVVEREPQRWLEKRIVDIPAARIDRIDVIAPGQGFALVRVPSTTKAPADGDAPTDSFVIEDIGTDEMASPYASDAISSALSELDLVDVHARKSAPAPGKGASVLRFVLRNGVTVIATAWQKDGNTLLQLRAEPTPPVASNDAASPEASKGGEVAAATGGGIAAEKASSAVTVGTAVAAFNAQWKDWTYVLPPLRSAGMNPSRSALLKPREGS